MGKMELDLAASAAGATSASMQVDAKIGDGMDIAIQGENGERGRRRGRASGSGKRP